MKRTHKDRILEYLQNYKKITDTEARDDLGCRRLSEYIRQLREDGYLIISNWKKGINRFGESVRYVEYEYKED